MKSEMTATITNKEDRHEVVLGEDRDGVFRWYLGDYDTEVSGKTIAEACKAASESWGSRIEFNFEVPA